MRALKHGKDAIILKVSRLYSIGDNIGLFPIVYADRFENGQDESNIFSL